MSEFTRFFALWFPVIAWAGLIFGLSSVPGLSTGLGRWDFIARKLAHVGEYAVFTLLLQRAYRRTWPEWSLASVQVWSAMIAVLYAASDEIHQAFVPRRGPSVRDVLIDSVGVALAIWAVRRRRLFEGKQ